MAKIESGQKSLKPIIITPGDPAGIGPEITWKAIQSPQLIDFRSQIICVGARAPFEKLNAPIIEVGSDLTLPLSSTRNSDPVIQLLSAPTTTTQNSLLEGFQAGWSIEKATRLVQSGQASALVTGPIHKERLQQGGYLYPGHTEFLASLCERREVTMMLANQILRVSLVTIHVGIREVSQVLTPLKIKRAIQQTAEGLRDLWGIQKPRIAVAALNPHAGEGGLFGREEIEIIVPVISEIKHLSENNFDVAGPFPADTLFAKHFLAKPQDRYDAIVCMYHDQGLIPVKLLDFHNTVNITLGLPMIRTSVDHGVGFDIVGKNIADPSSLCAAVKLAAEFVRRS